MFELFLLLSRYLFLFYILYFLWQAGVVLREEVGKSYQDPDRALFKQRVAVVLMHYTGFLLLSYEQDRFSFSLPALALGLGGVVFLLVGFFVTEKIYRNSDSLLWNCFFFLLDVSLIMLERLNHGMAVKQLIWMSLGLAVALLMPLVLRLLPWLEKMKYVYLSLGLALILCTLFFGNEEFGSVNWIYIGNFSFQPSEIVKFLFVFYLAAEFRGFVGLRQIGIATGYAGVLVLLLVFQKDLGGALIFFMTFMLVLYMATSNMPIFFGGMGLASIAAYLAYRWFPHVQVRVAAWQNPWADIDAGGYQIAQSLFAIGTGGFLGSGLMRGMPKSIPVVEKDFIFAAICEELGVVFGMCMILIFLVIFLRGMKIALKSGTRFHSLVAAGVVTMLAFQTFLILGGTMKLIPLTGVTLPFVSYGGSSVVVSILMLGLLQWIGKYHGLETEEDEDL